MSNTVKINTLWRTMEGFITTAYKSAEGKESAALRDYAEDVSWNHALAGLLKRETENERQHRRTRSNPQGFSAQTAARLLLMQNMGSGAVFKAAPEAVDFLIYRREAIEAQLIGWLCRSAISSEWRAALAEFDYAQLMRAA